MLISFKMLIKEFYISVIQTEDYAKPNPFSSPLNLNPSFCPKPNPSPNPKTNPKSGRLVHIRTKN